jgi:histidinol-phosphate phosphatase family protein
MIKAVFLDRDDTLIVDKVYLNDPDQIEYLPGVFDALRKLHDAGYALVIVTNQSGVARGLVTLENLAEIHRRITAEFAKHGITFVGIYYAPYSVESNHFLRKPNPGMLLDGARDHRLDLRRSWMVGDRMTDVEAGHRAGFQTVLLSGTEDPSKSDFLAPTFVANGLIECADMIIASERSLHTAAD